MKGLLKHTVFVIMFSISIPVLYYGGMIPIIQMMFGSSQISPYVYRISLMSYVVSLLIVWVWSEYVLKLATSRNWRKHIVLFVWTMILWLIVGTFVYPVLSYMDNSIQEWFVSLWLTDLFTIILTSRLIYALPLVLIYTILLLLLRKYSSWSC